ncbi:Lreu_0056 family protein [uncultured Limosilactobacillus sp.]|uniref:Lreu_0056 family protein n=2 Tax=uncultured Limosilactobacillus sp. TaxID=2837629 RepID=UPI001561C0D5|nr:hypothetical protein [uncultured Limosilactobacillus sp.]
MMKKRILIIVLIFTVCIAIGAAFWNSQQNNARETYHTSSQVEKRLTPVLTDQQISILVGLEVSPNWVREQVHNNNLIYGVVKPSDTAPAGVENYSYLVTTDKSVSPIIFFKADSNQSITIKYADHEGDQLHVKEVKESKLIHKFYRTSNQKKQVNNDVSLLRTE